MFSIILLQRRHHYPLTTSPWNALKRHFFLYVVWWPYAAGSRVEIITRQRTTYRPCESRLRLSESTLFSLALLCETRLILNLTATQVCRKIMHEKVEDVLNCAHRAAKACAKRRHCVQYPPNRKKASLRFE